MTAAGFPALVGGNIGTPAISLAERAQPETVIVLEISSFQLETIRTFRPKVAVILNVTPDHLDRHRTFEAYVDAKARIFENQQASDFAVLNADDPTCVAMASRTRAQVFWFSRQKEVEQGAWVRDGNIVFRDAKSQQREIMQVSEIPLKGAHNLENVLAAVSASVLMGCAADKIRQAVRDFKAVEHRLEFVATIRGVDYYNDSKATNVDATIKALESFPANIHLILGGKDKGSDYSVLNELLRQRVKRVYTIGTAAAKIESQIKNVEVVHAETLENAIRKASAVAQPGDVVLLAPACASFDQFKNYEHRGKAFKEIVRGLASETP
jgi:UDP-N-acetylmuramoylalanine--D-glutamate ligase